MTTAITYRRGVTASKSTCERVHAEMLAARDYDPSLTASRARSAGYRTRVGVAKGTHWIEVVDPKIRGGTVIDRFPITGAEAKFALA